MLKTIIGVVLIIVFAVIVFHTFSEKQEGVGNGCIAPGGKGKPEQSCCHDMATFATQWTRFCGYHPKGWHTPRENVSGLK